MNDLRQYPRQGRIISGGLGDPRQSSLGELCINRGQPFGNYRGMFGGLGVQGCGQQALQSNMQNQAMQAQDNLQDHLLGARISGLLGVPYTPKPELPKDYNDMDYKQFNTLYGYDHEFFVKIAIKCHIANLNMKVSDYMRQNHPMTHEPKHVDNAEYIVSKIQLKNEYIPVKYDKYRSFFGLDISYRLCMLIIKWSNK